MKKLTVVLILIAFAYNANAQTSTSKRITSKAMDGNRVIDISFDNLMYLDSISTPDFIKEMENLIYEQKDLKNGIAFLSLNVSMGNKSTGAIVRLDTTLKNYSAITSTFSRTLSILQTHSSITEAKTQKQRFIDAIKKQFPDVTLSEKGFYHTTTNSFATTVTYSWDVKDSLAMVDIETEVEPQLMLMHAIEKEDTVQVANLVERFPALKLYKNDNDGQNEIHFLSHTSTVDQNTTKTRIVYILATSGMPVDEPDAMDRTPLIQAVESGYVEMVKVLLAVGANPAYKLKSTSVFTKSDNNKTALEIAQEYYKSYKKGKSVYDGQMRDNLKQIVDILSAKQ